jgi:hypothetical protein
MTTWMIMRQRTTPRRPIRRRCDATASDDWTHPDDATAGAVFDAGRAIACWLCTYNHNQTQQHDHLDHLTLRSFFENWGFSETWAKLEMYTYDPRARPKQWLLKKQLGKGIWQEAFGTRHVVGGIRGEASGRRRLRGSIWEEASGGLWESSGMEEVWGAGDALGCQMQLYAKSHKTIVSYSVWATDSLFRLCFRKIIQNHCALLSSRPHSALYQRDPN